MKFFNQNSRTVNEIRIMKISFEPLSADYRQLFHEFHPGSDNIDAELQL